MKHFQHFYSIVAQLRGHTAELSSCLWNFSSDLIATGSLDSTARVWDLRKPTESLFTINDHTDEVLDVTFDSTGRLLATGSNDCTARVWNLKGDLEMVSLMAGHVEEISKVLINSFVSKTDNIIDNKNRLLSRFVSALRVAFC